MFFVLAGSLVAGIISVVHRIIFPENDSMGCQKKNDVVLICSINKESILCDYFRNGFFSFDDFRTLKVQHHSVLFSTCIERGRGLVLAIKKPDSFPAGMKMYAEVFKKNRLTFAIRRAS